MYRENDDIIINLTVTQKCFAACKGCINSTLTFAGMDQDARIATLECDPERDALLVARIAEKYPDRQVIVCFYGGEPFIEAGRMEKVRALLNASPAAGRTAYMVYSNGELIGNAIEKYPDLIRDIRLYSISIDGSRQQHEQARPGTSLARTIDSLIKLRKASDGSVLVWSTLREEQSLMDCFRQFISMHRNGLADHFFWHFADTGQPYADFKVYSKRYRDELEQVMEHYVSWLSDGEILPIAHINELVLYLLEGKKRGHTACAVELAQNYDILGGRVYACSDLPPSLGAYAAEGGIDIAPATLQSLVSYRDKLGCHSCNMYFYCGGRCPVQALAGSPQRTEQICKLIHIHVNTVKQHTGYIGRMLSKHGITRQQVYDRSAFIARYTDVIP